MIYQLKIALQHWLYIRAADLRPEAPKIWKIQIFHFLRSEQLLKAKYQCKEPCHVHVEPTRERGTQNLPGKLSQQTKLFCFDIGNGLKNIFFRNKTFLLFKIES
jgi:hypothetical protein